MNRVNERYSDNIRALSFVLKSEGRFEDVLTRLAAMESNARRVDYAHILLQSYDYCPEFVPDRKDNAAADGFRKEGNRLFGIRSCERALECYTKSVLHAEKGTASLAIAYANRSAVLFEAGYYKECLEDIENALDNNYPEELRPKLITRRDKCLKLKGSQSKPPYHQKIPSIIPSSSIPCATDSVKITKTRDRGRCVVATKDIQLGEVIAVEKPYSCMLDDQFLNHCRECLKLCYNLIPCEECTVALYCNRKCRDDAKEFHRYECRILKTLMDIKMDLSKLLSLKIAVTAAKDFRSKSTKFDGVYRSDRYAEIHELVDNSDKRSKEDIYWRCIVAAIFYHLVKTFTDLFHTGGDEEVFKELIVKHIEAAASNSHNIAEIDPYNQNANVGCGMYAFFSLFNHSCAPNVAKTTHGTVKVMRALKTIRRGEELLDKYGPHYAMKCKYERQAFLRRNYCFSCTCKACEEDWPIFTHLPNLVQDWNLGRLDNCDVEYAKSILEDVLDEVKRMEKLEPNKLLFDKQEVLKQCWSLQANVRPKFI